MNDQFWLRNRNAETKRLAPGPHFGGIDRLQESWDMVPETED